MSSDVVLVLWDPSRHGTPKSFSDVISVWNNLEDVEDSPSERILAFAQQVQEQALKNPEDYEDYVDMVDWIGKQTTALIEIDLPTDDWQRPLVLLAEAAMACKLVGIAESLLIAFLPTGKILPPEQTASWKGLKAFLNEDNGLPRNIKQYKKLIEPMCDLLFTKHGYTKKILPADWKGNVSYNKDHMYYIRDIQIGHQEVSIEARGGGVYFTLAVGIRVSCNAVNEIYKQFGFIYFDDDTFYINFGIIKAAHYNRDPYGGSLDPISRAQINTDFVEMETLLFPFLDQALDIQALDQLMNGDINPRFREAMHRGFYIPHCLIVARLAGNPHFEELVTKFEELSFAGGAWGANRVAKATELPKLVKYLREEVTPLVHIQESLIMNQQPRSHHIQMKYLLIKLMLTEPEETFTLYSSNEGDLFLSRLWHHVGTELPVAEQLSNQGAAVHYRPQNYNNEAVVLIFPEPKCRNEAWFLGAFRNTEGTIRVFCLEQSFTPNHPEPYTMLAEISLNGRANWGVGSEPSVEAFMESVDDIMGDDSNEPLTFTAMPMF